MDREAYYRRWKLGKDPHALAKEAGVTRERMRHMLAKMDAEVPLVDRLTAAEARVKELEAALREIEADCDAQYPPSHGAIKYCIRAALKGEKT